MTAVDSSLQLGYRLPDLLRCYNKSRPIPCHCGIQKALEHLMRNCSKPHTGFSLSNKALVRAEVYAPFDDSVREAKTMFPPPPLDKLLVLVV
jgi:hypothetical protein